VLPCNVCLLSCRAELAEKQRQKEERAAAAVAIKASKTAATAAAAAAGAAGRAAAAQQVSWLPRQLHAYMYVCVPIGHLTGLAQCNSGACAQLTCCIGASSSGCPAYCTNASAHAAAAETAVAACVQAAADAKHVAKAPSATTADSSSFKTPAPPKAATRLGGGLDATAAAAAGGGAKGPCAGGDREVSPSLTITVLDPVSTGVCCSGRLRMTPSGASPEHPVGHFMPLHVWCLHYSSGVLQPAYPDDFSSAADGHIRALAEYILSACK
jgi:hypothetical protein